MNIPIRSYPNNPALKGMAFLAPDITYSNVEGMELKLTMIRPWTPEKSADTGERYPLIVFIQGCSWTFPNVNYEIPQLSDWARRGYVVATVTHRNCLEGHPAPAFLKDVKTAIRFLRSHAEEYRIDPDRVCAWGTSSGGNTALLLGTTGNDPAFRTEEYPEESDAVQAVVECFGPTDLLHFGKFQNNICDLIENGKSGERNIFYALGGSDDPEVVEKRLKDISPIYHVEEGCAYPPFLLLHGNADPVVDYDQSVRMLKRLTECGVDANLICVEGAPHEGSFWSEAILEEIRRFIADKIG